MLQKNLGLDTLLYILRFLSGAERCRLAHLSKCVLAKTKEWAQTVPLNPKTILGVYILCEVRRAHCIYYLTRSPGHPYIECCKEAFWFAHRHPRFEKHFQPVFYLSGSTDYWREVYVRWFMRLREAAFAAVVRKIVATVLETMPDVREVLDVPEDEEEALTQEEKGTPTRMYKELFSHAPAVEPLMLVVGDFCDVRDRFGNWYPAQVCLRSGDRVFVDYISFSVPTYNEWLWTHTERWRIAPKGTETKHFLAQGHIRW